MLFVFIIYKLVINQKVLPLTCYGVPNLNQLYPPALRLCWADPCLSLLTSSLNPLLLNAHE